MMEIDLKPMRHAIRLAREAQHRGNLPIGAVICLDGAVVAEGRNTIWRPRYRPNRHAEIEALEAVPGELWSRAGEMTLYTTLEPCMMCTGAILVHRIGRVIYGAADERGGVGCTFGHMPPAFERLLRTVTWIGPALPDECDPLNETVIALLRAHNQDEPDWE